MLKPTDWKAVRKGLQKFLALEKDFAERFKTAHSSRSKLKKGATTAVVHAEWFTGLYNELDPTFFMLGLREGKPARQLKKDPGSNLGVVRYGYDAKSRLVHVEKCMAWDEYREHQPSRIDATRFHIWEKNCLDIQTLFFDGNQPVAHIKSDNNWLEIKRYEFQGDKIVCVFTASKRIDVTDSKWAFGKYEIFEKRYGIYEIRYEVDSHKPGTSCMLRYHAPIPPQVKDKARWKNARRMLRPKKQRNA